MGRDWPSGKISRSSFRAGTPPEGSLPARSDRIAASRLGSRALDGGDPLTVVSPSRGGPLGFHSGLEGPEPLLVPLPQLAPAPREPLPAHGILRRPLLESRLGGEG